MCYSESMKIVATSDLHGSFPKIPECDLLLIAGDVCPVVGSHHPMKQMKWLRTTFREWLEEQPAKNIVWIAGNHDFGCEGSGFWRIADRDISPENTHYLCDDTVEIDGLKIHGNPWTPNLVHWAFYASTERFQEIAYKLPEDTDILVLHSPPAGVGLDGNHPDWGAPHIASRLQVTLPKLCVFGHIHEGYGTRKIGEVEFANVAHMDMDYNPVNPPVEFIW